MAPSSLLALWLLVQPPSAEPPGPPRFEEELVVTPERGAEARAETPAAVSVLTRDEIASLPAENLAELLGEMPGFEVVFPEGFGLAPMVSTRGFFGGGEVEYVQLLVDGVPVGDAESGLADWRRIRAADVERVEALRGPGSSLYGDTALGGVVQVFRRVSAQAPVKEVAVSGGTFGSWAADAAYKGGAGGTARVGASATATRTDGFRSRSAAEEAAADLWLGGGSRTPWSVALSASSRDREDPGPLSAAQLAGDRLASDPLFRFDREESRRGRLAFALRREGGRWPLRAVAYGALRQSRSLRTVLLVEGVGDRARRDLSTQSAGGSLETERSVGRGHGLRAGLDLGRDWVDTSYRSVDEAGVTGARTASANGRRERIGVYASADWRAAARVRLTAGLRFDAIRDAGATSVAWNRAWSPRVGATVLLGTRTRSPVAAFAQLSRAFKAATLDQLLDPRPFPDFRGGTFHISNPGLTPQRASTLEAGLSQRRAGGRWEVVAYRTAVADEIDFDPATFRYRNIGRSRHYGIEASVRMRDGAALSPHVAYAWTRVEAGDEDGGGRQLKNIPEHRLRAGLTARLPAGVRAELRAAWSAGRWLDDANAFALADERVVDVRIWRAFRRLRARLDALNLTDRQWEPLGVTVPDFTGGVAPYYWPAPGRSVRAGLEWTF
jgi:outer membrane cobalamin receptor